MSCAAPLIVRLSNVVHSGNGYAGADFEVWSDDRRGGANPEFYEGRNYTFSAKMFAARVDPCTRARWRGHCNLPVLHPVPFAGRVFVIAHDGGC